MIYFEIGNISYKKRTYWNKERPETTWNQSYYSIFLLKISVFKSFLGKFGLKNWSSPDQLTFGTGVHCYNLISNLMFIFPKFLSFTFFEQLRVQNLDFSKLTEIWYRDTLRYMLITILMFIFPRFLSLMFFGQIWSHNLDFFKLT